MKLSTRISRGFAHSVWNAMPPEAQKIASKAWSILYRTRASAFMVKAFCYRYKIGPEEMSLYVPASGGKRYLSFQDFFTRRLVNPVTPATPFAWPCQGYICNFGRLGTLDPVEVKGQKCLPRRIFKNDERLTNDHYFVNVFLHNHNYHRFHAPVSGRIRQIEFQNGELNFLRPWLYRRENVSEPALRNERVTVEIEDIEGRSWFLCFVAGMGVGGLKLANEMKVGAIVACGQELGGFLLGSTCCMAIPFDVSNLRYMLPVEVGHEIQAPVAAPAPFKDVAPSTWDLSDPL